MALGFPDIPEVVIDYVREIFAIANDKVSRTVTTHPNMHEETLDHMMVLELTAAPPAFFAQEQMAVSLETHWLGHRWMFGRWEIADIAFFVLLRQRGNLLSRKVVLLQTKRLYCAEIPVTELDEADYVIGIGRLVDRIEPTVPLSNQRAFAFNQNSFYQATYAGHPQVSRIDRYVKSRGIPVYYGLYNPITLPYDGWYPSLDGLGALGINRIGCRVLPARSVHGALRKLPKNQSPSVANLIRRTRIDRDDPMSTHGWRLERFMADQVLRCRQGKASDDVQDPNLRGLLYGRAAPIFAAISITIEFGADHVAAR